MQIKTTFKNFEPSDHLRSYATQRFEKLTKYLQREESCEIQVNMEVEKFRQKADVLIVGKNLHLSAAEQSEDMYSTIDMVLDKLEAQLKKKREKEKQIKRGPASSVRLDVISFTQTQGGARERTIVETDHYEPKPMSVDEAAMQLESLQYEFLVFLNAGTDRVNVIYRRRNGDFGLIDPGFEA